MSEKTLDYLCPPETDGKSKKIPNYFQKNSLP